MVKITKTYRLEQQSLNDLEKIRRHLNSRKETVSDELGVKFKEATSTEAMEFALKYCKDVLAKEGYNL